MKQKLWLIYKHTNNITQEAYIGQTYTSTKERWKNGKGYAKSQKVFLNAINEFGWENFSHEILEDNIDSQELADLREQYWISYYHTYIGDPLCKGYNMTPGGGTSTIHRIKICYQNDLLNNKMIYDVELANYELLGWRAMTKAEVKAIYYQEHRDEILLKSKELGKQYRERHREQLREKNREYAKQNSEKVKAKQKEWFENNKEHEKIRKQKWNDLNKDKLKEKAKNYYQEHRTEILLKRKAYAETHKEKIKKYKAEYQRNYRKKVK